MSSETVPGAVGDRARSLPAGGVIEPLRRASILKEALKLADLPDAPRYELRDLVTDITYRSNSFDEMTVKADRLGVLRFVAIASDGKRTTVTKDGGQWHRPEPQLRATASDRQTGQPGKEPAAAAPTRSQPDRARDDRLGHAERAKRLVELEAALNARYLIKRSPLRIGHLSIGETEYRHRGGGAQIAFTESAFKLSTDTNDPSVARSMVDVAEARRWQGLRVSGSEDFKRMAWLEASLRDIRTVGYESVAGDQELLHAARAARQPDRIGLRASEPATARKDSIRGGASRKTVLAALEAVLVAKRVPAEQREIVMAAAADNLARRLRSGETYRVKVYDPKAPSRRPAVVPSRDLQHARERAAPAR